MCRTLIDLFDFFLSFLVGFVFALFPFVFVFQFLSLSPLFSVWFIIVPFAFSSFLSPSVCFCSYSSILAGFTSSLPHFVWD
jgi:hypothetical protein